MMTTIEELLMSAEYILSEGNEQVILCERGIRTFETATRNTLDISAVPVLKELTHLPVIIDPSHASGHAKYVIPLTRAAVAVGADGIIVEIHPEPEKAVLRRSPVAPAGAVLPAHGRGQPTGGRDAPRNRRASMKTLKVNLDRKTNRSYEIHIGREILDRMGMIIARNRWAKRYVMVTDDPDRRPAWRQGSDRRWKSATLESTGSRWNPGEASKEHPHRC